MKKQLLLLSVLMAAGWQAQSQNTFINENFDSYTANGFAAVQSPFLTTWTNNPGSAEDALVSNEVANSGNNSLRINNASQDMVVPIGPFTSGLYTVEFYMYIPASSGGYFNIMHNWPAPYQWACQVYFGSGGAINWTAGGTPGQGASFPHAQWFKVLATINMDTDLATMNINNVDIFSFQFSLDDSNGMQGANQLAAVNFYGAAAQGSTPFYYIDDIKVTDVNGVSVAESGIRSELSAYPNPANDVLNISTNGLSPVLVTLFDISGKVVHNKTLNQAFARLNVAGLTDGIYFIQMVQDGETTTKKLVIRH